MDSVLIVLGNKDTFKGYISFSKIPSIDTINKEKSIVGRVLEIILYNKNHTYTEYVRAAHYSRLNDYSWWNLLYNIRLFELLTLKAIGLHTSNFVNFKVYDLGTPFLRGFLRERKFLKKEEKSSSIDVSFDLKDKSYTILFIGPDEISNKSKDIISTVQPIDDIEKNYKEMKALYKNKENSRYPEELILLSMISLKGSTKENLQELLKIMEKKQYEPYIIKEIKKEIEFQKIKQ